MHAGDVLQDQQQDAADDEGVAGDGRDFGELFADLNAVTVKATRGQRNAIERRNGLIGEDASQEGADHATNAVKLEHVKAFVDADPRIEVLEAGAHDSSKEADERGRPARNVTCRKKMCQSSRSVHVANAEYDTYLRLA